MGYRGIVWRYLPGQPNTHYWATLVDADDPYVDPNTDPETHDLSVVRDDRPFPYAVYRGPGAAHEVMLQVALLATIMVLFPAFLTYFARRRADPQRKRATGWQNSLLLGYFAVLGVAYLVIEIVLIQKFGIFLASPSYSLAVVLATMLIASGAGGYVSRGAHPKHCLIAMFCVVLGATFIAFGLDRVLSFLMPLPFPVRIVMAMALIAPIAFAMGFPFPFAMAYAKQALSDRHAGLFFAINGAVGATAAPLTLIWTMQYGFTATALLGGGAYLLGLLLLGATRIDKPLPGTV
jgi:hypothetical protein